MQVKPEGHLADTRLLALWLDFNPGDPRQVVHVPISAHLFQHRSTCGATPNQHKKLAETHACMLLSSHAGPPVFSTTKDIMEYATGPQTTVLVTAPNATWPDGSSNAVSCNISDTNLYPVGSSLIVCYTSDTATGYMETVSFWINVGEAATFPVCFTWSMPVSANMLAFTQSSSTCCALRP